MNGVARIGSAAALILFSSASSAVAIDPDEFFAYEELNGPMRGVYVVLSRSNCGVSEAQRTGWKKAAYLVPARGGRRFEACWVSIEKGRDGSDMKVCRVVNGELGTDCMKGGKNYFLATSSLPRSAGF